MTQHNLPLVVVEWNDAWASAEQPVTLADVKVHHKPEVITTIGWLLLDDEHGVSLANEYYEDGYRGRSFIPRGMVKSVTRFTLAKPRKPRVQEQEKKDE